MAMSIVRAAAAAGGLLFLLAQNAAAQEHPPGCTAFAGTVTREVLERPIGIQPGVGEMHQKVSTRSAKAQAYYDQGIAYAASYVWVGSARSFHAALRLDPKLAMAQLGLAKAYVGAEALDDARPHLERAEALAREGVVSDKEASWIRLGRQQFDALTAPEAEQAERLAGYRAGIEELIKLDPNDAHAWVLRGNAEEPGIWGRGQAGGVGSIAFYETALRRDPKHIGALHFLAHSYENIGQPEAATAYARQYAAAASGVGHAQHMLGHVLPRLGRWQEARDQFLKADALERSAYGKEKLKAEEDWHHGHNLHLLAAVYLHLGDDAKAERAFREAFELQERGPMAGSYAAPYVQFLLLRDRNPEALAAAQDLQRRPSDIARLIGTALEAEALLGLGRLDEARAKAAQSEELQAQVQKGLAGTPYARFAPVLTVQYIDILRGRLLLRGPHPEEGEEILLAMADEVGRNPRLDAWASGMLRVDRAAADADRLQRRQLASEIRKRTANLRK